MLIKIPNEKLHYLALYSVIALELLDVLLIAYTSISVPMFLPVSLVIIALSMYNIYKLYGNLLLALIYLYPFSFVTEYRINFGFFKSSFIELISIAIAGVYLLTLRKRENFIIVLVVASLFLFLVNVFFVESGDSVFAVIGKSRRMLLPFITLSAIYKYRYQIDERYCWFILTTMVFIYIVPATIGLIQYTTGNLFIEMGDVEYDFHKEENASKYMISVFLGLPSRLSQGLTAYANNFSFWLVFFIIQTISFFYTINGWRSKLFSLCLVFLYFFSILTTYSRGGIIFALFVMLIYFFISKKDFFISKLVSYFLSLSVIGVIALLFFIPGSALGSLFFRIKHLLSGILGLTDLKTILFGQSILSYRATHDGFVPHNNFMGLIYDHGMIIFTIYMGIIMYFIVKSYSNYKLQISFLNKKEIYIYKGLFVSIVYLMFLESFNYYSFFGINRTVLTTFSLGIMYAVVSKKNN